jgi:AsmA protein
MKSLIKALVGIIGGIIILLILAAILLPLIYDSEDLKNAIAGAVHEQTGRELSIVGDLDFSVFPWLAVQVSDLSLSNAEGFGDAPFARIGQARVGVALMPLFSKQIVADEITLDELQLDLAVNAEGKNNWDDLAGSDSDDAAAPGETESAIFSSQRVAGLNISDARVEYRDQQAGAHYRLSGFSIETGALGDGGPVPIELQTLLEDLTAGTSAQVTMAATAAIDLEAGQYVFDGLELNLAFAADDPGGPSTQIKLSTPHLSADLAKQTLGMDDFSAVLMNLEAAGSLSATNILDDLQYSGSLEVAEFSPAGLMQALQMEAPVTADPGVLQKAAFQASLKGNSSRFTLGNLQLELDQSRLDGELSVRNLDQDKPRIVFDFDIDEMDLDRYMAPAGDPASAQSDDIEIPASELQELRLKGDVRVARLRMAGLDFSDATIGITIRNGKLRMNPLTATFYGGTYSGDITLDGSGPAPVLSLDENMVGDLVDDESLSGLAQGHVRLTGRGATSSEILRTLGGEINLSLSEGAYEGINIWYEIRKGLAQYKGMAPPDPEPARTVFSRLQLAASVADGVVNTRELIGQLPFLTLTGNGAVDLGQSMVDLGLVAAVSDSPDLAGDPLAADLAGKRLPLKVSGALDDPGISIDWEELLKAEATDMLLDKLGLISGDSSDTETDEGSEVTADGETTEAEPKEEAAKALFDMLLGGGEEEDGGDNQ